MILLFITLVFISFFYLSNEKKAYHEKIKELNELEIKAKEYITLSTQWKNEKFVNKTLDEILKNSMFKNEKIVKVENKESIKIKFESTNSYALDNFLNRILNKPLIIKRLELDKNYINLEIGLK
jgi:preprotein translocase subunit SecF